MPGRDSWIDNETFESLRHTGSSMPILHGLRRIHTPHLLATNSRYHAIVRSMAELLEPLRKPASVLIVNDPFHFLDTTRNSAVSYEVTPSLSVIALSINSDPIENIYFMIRSLTSNYTNMRIPIDSLREFNAQFLFSGVAMVSSSGSILAEFFTGMTETNQLK